MRLIALSLIIFAGSLLLAQPTLTRSSMWQAGDTYDLVAAVEGSVVEGPGGANQSWNFSNLQSKNEPRRIDLILPSSTPFAASFPQSTLAQLDWDGQDQVGYTYWKLDNGELTLLGVAVPELIVQYTDPQKVFTFPFSYGGTIQDTAAATFTTNGATVSRSVTAEVVADGYGTVILPGNKSYQVLRVKYVQKITDTMNVSGFNLVTRTDTTSYIYYDPNEKHPVLNISYIVNDTGFTVMESKVVYYRNLEGGSPTPSAQRLLPHLTSPTGGFQTTLLLRNAGSSSGSFALQAFASDGSSLPEVSRSVEAGHLASVLPSELFGSSPLSHVQFSGSSALSLSAAYRSVSEGASCHVHHKDEPATLFRVYPGEPDVVFDGMALVNLGQEPSTLTLRALGGGGGQASFTLGAGLKQLVVFDSIFPQPPPLIEIRSSEPASAVFLRGSRPGTVPAYLYVNEPQNVVVGTRWIPHVTRVGGGFETRVFFHNSAQGASTVNLTPYSLDGQPLAVQQVTVQAESVLVRTAAELFGSASVSHFQVDGPAELAVSAAYKASGTTGASAHVHQTDDSRLEFLLFPGERSLVFDGMALVNVGNAPSVVKVSQLSSTGAVLAQVEIQQALPLHAKALVTFDSLFAEQAGATLRVSTSQPAVVVFLRGNPVGSNPAYLYTNPALPKP